MKNMKPEEIIAEIRSELSNIHQHLDAVALACARDQQGELSTSQGCVLDCNINSKGGWTVTVHFDVPIEIGAKLAPVTETQEHLKEPEDSTVLKQNKLLVEALGSCIMASGIVRKDVDGLTGPQLLLFAEDLREMLESKSAQQDAQAVPHQQDLKILMNRLENQAHRAGELWERCQGKSWSEKESAEFTALRDVKMPQTRAALAARLNAAPTPPAQAVPQGWKLVPEKLTVPMLDAAAWAGPGYAAVSLIQKAWSAILNAVPTPPAQQSKEEWITDEGRLQWAMWRIKDLEDQLKNRSLGCPVAWRVGHSGEYHYFTNRSDAAREKVEYENYSGEECGDVEPLYTQKSL